MTTRATAPTPARTARARARTTRRATATTPATTAAARATTATPTIAPSATRVTTAPTPTATASTRRTTATASAPRRTTARATTARATTARAAPPRTRTAWTTPSEPSRLDTCDNRLAMRSSRARRASGPLTRSILSSLVVLFGAGCRGDAGAGDGGEPEHFYALKVVPDFELRLAPGARESLKKDPRAWAHADFVYRGKTWKDVGVKIKGHRSLRTLDEKPSFKVRFDEFVDKQKFLGLKNVTLNNMVED